MVTLVDRYLFFLSALVSGAPPWTKESKFFPEHVTSDGEFVPSITGMPRGESVAFGALGENVESRAVSRAIKALSALGLAPHSAPLRKRLLSNAKCNDGSPAGYLPYCTSDCWSGTRKGSVNSTINNAASLLFSDKDKWHSTDFQEPTPLGVQDLPFEGATVIEETIKILVSLGIQSGHTLIVAGSSAGGIGVLLNVDRVHQHLLNLGLQVNVKGVADSAWFLDNEPFSKAECTVADACSAMDAIQIGFSLWDSDIPSRCRIQYDLKPWDCFLGYKVLPTIKRPMFIFQWIFDEAQMILDRVGKPVSKQQWNYIHSVGERLVISLTNVSSVFAPSCISHTVLTKMTWGSVKVSSVKLSDALYRWEKSNSFTDENYRKTKVNSQRTNPSSVEVTKLRLLYGTTEPTNGQSVSIRPKGVSSKRVKNGKEKCRKCKKKSATKIRKWGLSDNGTVENVSVVKMLADSPTVVGSVGELKRKLTKKERRRMKKKLRKKRRKLRRKRRKQRKKEREERRRQSKSNGYQDWKSSDTRSKRASFVLGNTSIQNSFDFEASYKEIEKSGEPPRATTEYPEEDAGKESDSDHLVDRCTWPHCNPSCPLLINPYTGDEMTRVQLLKSFGLNLEELADALGIDMPTLRAMNNKDIFHILTP